MGKGEWCVYMLEMSDGSLYTGATNNLESRLRTHKSGKGSKYVKRRLPIIRVAYVEPANDQSSALKREAAIKKLTRKQKERLINEQM
jgi:putative endonuclease